MGKWVIFLLTAGKDLQRMNSLVTWREVRVYRTRACRAELGRKPDAADRDACAAEDGRLKRC
jgi:hypothetical protein